MFVSADIFQGVIGTFTIVNDPNTLYMTFNWLCLTALFLPTVMCFHLHKSFISAVHFASFFIKFLLQQGCFWFTHYKLLMKADHFFLWIPFRWIYLHYLHFCVLHGMFYLVSMSYIKVLFNHPNCQVIALCLTTYFCWNSDLKNVLQRDHKIKGCKIEISNRPFKELSKKRSKKPSLSSVSISESYVWFVLAAI